MNGNNSNCTGPAAASQPIIAVIGGTGLENPEILQQREELATQETPWGEASTICTGLLGGVTRIFILSRHGKDHDKSPTQGYFFSLLYEVINLFSQLQRKLMGIEKTWCHACRCNYRQRQPSRRLSTW